MWYFDLWGLRSEFNTAPNYRKNIRFASVFQFLLGFLVSGLLIIYLRRTTNDPLGTLNDVMKHGGNLFVYWLTLIELCTKQSIRRKFWQIFNQIDCLYCNHQHFTLQNYLRKFHLCLFSYAMSFLLYLYVIVCHTGMQFIYFWFTHFILSILYFNRVFYYLFFLQLIAYELQNVESEVKEMVQMYRNKCVASDKIKRSSLCDFKRKQFIWIREYFQSIYKLCECLNEFLTYSNAAIILFSFQFIATDALWIYWKLYNKHNIQIG